MTNVTNQNTTETNDDHKVKNHQPCPTSRGVTLAMLIRDNIIKPGNSVLSIDYLGRKFLADLLDDGRIYWAEGNEQFGSPSAWAVHCKRLSNPDSKSGCGWASVKYAGRKLDSWKTTWYRYTHSKTVEETEVQPPLEVKPAVELDVRKIPPLDVITCCNIVDPHQIIQMIRYSQTRIKQPYKIEIDSSILFLLTLFASKGHDIDGVLLGQLVNQKHIQCHSVLLISPGEVETEIRSRLISCDDTIVGWFTFHLDYVHCGPTSFEVKTQSSFQNVIFPFIGLVINVNQKSIANSFKTYFTIRPEGNGWDIPIELHSSVVDMNNFNKNLKEFTNSYPHTSLLPLRDEEWFQPSLCNAIPDTKKFIDYFASE